jgi:outer membrane protein TolC
MHFRLQIQSECDRFKCRTLNPKERQADEADTYSHTFHSYGCSEHEFPDRKLDTGLLRTRPDIIANVRRLAASDERIGHAIAEYYPKISLASVPGSESTVPGNLFQQEAVQLSPITGLRWRLFDFARMDAEVKQARRANAEALLLYRHSILQASEEVEDAFNALAQFDAQRNEILKKNCCASECEESFRTIIPFSVIPLTDVLDADRHALLAKDCTAFTQETAAHSAVLSFRALGGGWESVDS